MLCFTWGGRCQKEWPTTSDENSLPETARWLTVLFSFAKRWWEILWKPERCRRPQTITRKSKCVLTSVSVTFNTGTDAFFSMEPFRSPKLGNFCRRSALPLRTNTGVRVPYHLRLEEPRHSRQLWIPFHIPTPHLLNISFIPVQTRVFKIPPRLFANIHTWWGSLRLMRSSPVCN